MRCYMPLLTSNQIEKIEKRLKQEKNEKTKKEIQEIILKLKQYAINKGEIKI